MPSPRRRRVLILTAAVVLLGVIATAVTLSTTGHRKTAPAAAPPRPVASSSPTTAATSPAPASSPPLDTTPLTTPPAGVTWQLFQGVALPSSATDGPTKIDGTVYAGFSHTPTGALLAASQIAHRYFLTPGTGWKDVVDQQVMPGPGRDAYVATRNQVADNTDTPSSGTYTQIAGFQFVTYDPNVAVVSFANSGNNGRILASPVTIRWSNGDWKLDLPAILPPAVTLPNLAGYVAWSGVA